MSLFLDRMDAGRQLAAGLREFAATPGVVLGLPRGGVPVAFALAQELRLPLDVFLVRKLGVPGQEELAMGAVAAGNVRVINAEVVRALGILPEQIARVADLEQQELERRAAAFRQGHPQLPVAGRTAIVVDDGLATGATARAALRSLRAARAGHLVLAVPVAPPSSAMAMRAEADQVVILVTPGRFSSVGEWYMAFGQLSDADVLRLLR